MKVKQGRLRYLVLVVCSFGFLIPTLAFATRELEPAMQATWQRTDGLVANGDVARSWLWGPQALHILEEPYNGGRRLVAYFDKSRMEINTPDGDRSSKWFVTNGLLVKEMVSGLQQIGDQAFSFQAASLVPVAGHVGFGNGGPNYKSFATVATLEPGRNHARDRTGETVTATINQQGLVGQDEQYGQYNMRNGYYEPTFGHNIPAVFWDFLNQTGPIYEHGARVQGPVIDWIYSTGYPLSEPFWAEVDFEYEADPPNVYPKRYIKRDVLIQLFERRVLTYTPSNPDGWRVEMGNTGKHYYIWRYEYPYR